jgi:hypothetical protein
MEERSLGRQGWLGPNSAPFVSPVADVPAVQDTTLYILLGDWFALAALLFALVQFCWLVKSPRLEKIRPCATFFTC